MATQSKLLSKFAASIGTLVFLGLIGASATKAQAAETFSVDSDNGGMALNTNNQFRKIDGQPRMSSWQRNDSDPDQQFDRLPGNRGGILLKHRSTGNCLNAHYLSNGAELNVWGCNADDPDQNFNVIDLGGGYNRIQRTGTNLCVDSPDRANFGKVHLWQCLDPSIPNQRWKSSAIVTPSTTVNWSSPAYRENNPFWKTFAPPSVGGTLDSQGNCTWYANGRLRELGYGANDLTRLTGNASYWITQAHNASIPTGKTAQVGAIAQWVGLNHVAVVEKVNTDGTILISESSYNYPPQFPNGYLYSTRTIQANSVDNYIYVRR
ncbi:CHAP domain-containing protein [Trichocoleus sp. FACHB-591]|uniref:CHAP domain-containing protein n=1 Tax=Trichocoleus sp. FACHB-591 TaxID=2692872 RepID=UPI001686F63B|nr:CHAP domain-containing protein [Trichocoleus sp. FACHB-591]MBD2097702.1 CHAP domain-containing protein [Trichocoleus sp. FACHB-591]